MKEQGSAALRIVAFAVALAVVLGLASVMFQVTASAEDVASVSSDNIPTSVTGTFGNYSAVKFTASNQIFDPSTVFTDYDKKSYIGVFAYEKDGKLVIYDDLYSYLNNGVIFFEFANGSFSGIDDLLFYILKTDKYKDSVSEQAAYFNNYVMLYHPKSDFNYSDLSQNLPLNMFPSRIITFDGFTDLYMIYTTATGILSKSDCKSKIADMTADVNKMSISQWQSSDSSSPSAEFLSFKGTESSGLYLVDWIKTGQQYPIVDFRIDDKGNYHKYALRISGNSNYAEILKGIWDRQEMKEAASAASNAIGLWLLLKTVGSLGTKAVVSIAGASTPIGALFLNVPKKDVTGYVMLAAQNKLVQEYDTLSYDDIRTLTSDNMNFSEGSSTVSKAVSLCLSDYVSVVPNTLYKLEIIDVTESKLLDVAYFSSQRGYQKSDSGYGTNITDYDNSADLDSDIENNNGYTGGSSSNGGKLDTDNPNDIIDTDYNNSLANINISDIIVSLRTSIASVGVFFQSCWALFPPAIWSIILLGLSLIVVLRLLGR